MSATLHRDQARARSREVFFTGSTALEKGQGLCYDRDTGTATSIDGKRDKDVELPSNTNNRAFAGTCARDYAARSGGQWVEVNEPSSVCLISTLIPTTVNATYLTAINGGGSAGKGRFAGAGFQGRGTAKALQTIAAITSATSTTPGPISSSLDNSATLDAAGTTLTKTSAFTYAAAGDYVYIVGGATTASGAAVVTAGRYTISSVTSANVVVLSSAACAAASVCSFYLVRGNPTILAELQDGIESGLVEYLQVYTDGSGTTAVPAQLGGVTLLQGGITLANGDAIETLADGTVVGEWKRFKLMGALTSNDYQVTVTTGEQLDGSTDLAGMEFDGDGDDSTLQWGGTKWRLIHNAGTGLS